MDVYPSNASRLNFLQFPFFCEPSAFAGLSLLQFAPEFPSLGRRPKIGISLGPHLERSVDMTQRRVTIASPIFQPCHLNMGLGMSWAGAKHLFEIRAGGHEIFTVDAGACMPDEELFTNSDVSTY